MNKPQHPLARFRATTEPRLKQDDLAQMLGISKGYLALIEIWAKEPSPSLARTIERVTNGEVTPNDLYLVEATAPA